MESFLSYLDGAVKLLVVITLARTVWNGTTRSGLLSVVLTVVFLVFGVVSMCAAAGLTSDTPFNQNALLIFLLLIAIVATRGWARKPAR